MQTANNGWAIFVSLSSSTKILIEKAYFYNCHAIDYVSGAIFFGDEGDCVLDKVCCYGASACNFDFISCSKDAEYKNQVNDTIISRTINKDSETVLSNADWSIIFKKSEQFI